MSVADWVHRLTFGFFKNQNDVLYEEIKATGCLAYNKNGPTETEVVWNKVSSLIRSNNLEHDRKLLITAGSVGFRGLGSDYNDTNCKLEHFTQAGVSATVLVKLLSCGLLIRTGNNQVAFRDKLMKDLLVAFYLVHASPNVRNSFILAEKSALISQDCIRPICKHMAGLLSHIDPPPYTRLQDFFTKFANFVIESNFEPNLTHGFFALCNECREKCEVLEGLKNILEYLCKVVDAQVSNIILVLMII